MTPELKAFIKTYVKLPDEELEQIAGKFRRRTVKKNEYLLRQGEICGDLVFVQEGCLRLYNLADDIEVSVWFSFKHSSAIELYSFISERTSEYFLQAIEAGEILYLSKPALNQLYETYPKMQEMMRKFWEDVVINLVDRFTALQRDPAEKRYRDLLKKPAYLQKIPQKHLASFIGVTPTSLSRIRKKVAKKS